MSRASIRTLLRSTVTISPLLRSEDGGILAGPRLSAGRAFARVRVTNNLPYANASGPGDARWEHCHFSWQPNGLAAAALLSLIIPLLR